MSQIEPNDFEERWRKAFEEASEPPSDKLWDGIERQLLPERPIGLPFFWVGAVLLLLGLGWWWMASGDSAAPLVSETHTVSPGKSGTSKTTIPAVGNPAKEGAKKGNSVPHPAAAGTSASEAVVSEAAASEAAGSGSRTSDATTSDATTSDAAASNTASSNRKATGTKTTNPEAASRIETSFRASGGKAGRRLQAQGSGHYAAIRDGVKPSVSAPQTVKAGTLHAETTAPELSPISVTAPAERPVSLQVRPATLKPWSLLPVNRHAEAPATAMPNLKKKPFAPKFWIGLNASLIRFDPQVKYSNDYISTLNSLYSGINQSLGSAYVPAQNVSRSKAGYNRKGSHVSFLAEVTAGYAFSRHWYVESGLSFLRGHSTITDNLVLIDRTSSERTSIYNQYLEDSKASTNNVPNSPSNGSGYLSSKNVVVYTSANAFRYTFEYLSVPVSVGYRFQPEKRLNYFVSAGVTTDFFVKNILKDDSDIAIPTATYYPGDKVYHNLSLSGTGAAGVNYKIGPRWALSLKTFVRKNFTGGIHGNYLQIHPVTLGVGAGIRKEF